MNETSLMGRTELRRTVALSPLQGTEQQSRLGQFFTPKLAAELIASFPRLPSQGHVRVLDPGAGVGSLAAALVQRVIDEGSAVSLDITCIELDETMAPGLQETLRDCVETAKVAGIHVDYTIVIDDYLEHPGRALYDIVVMNPPYLKLEARSRYRKLLSAQGVEAPNLYAAFLGMGALSLAADGQLVAITPRSFTNGTYFGRFRNFFLQRLALDRIHVFDSRSTVFSDTGVLQENIIFAATRGGHNETTVLSASTGHKHEIRQRIVPTSDIVHPEDANQFIRIPIEENDAGTVGSMLGLPATLADLHVAVSTGKVVDFRSRDQLTTGRKEASYPMVYPANFQRGVIEHPKAAAKAQWFTCVDDKDSKLLLPSGTYVIIKRFSAKEERRRIVAAVWTPGQNGTSPVAIDNKTNYIHSAGEGLDPALAVGLSLWLNSSVVDNYFRTFSGHTQVNATDLRSMRFPSRESLIMLGEGRCAALPEQDEIDKMVNDMMGMVAAA